MIENEIEQPVTEPELQPETELQPASEPVEEQLAEEDDDGPLAKQAAKWRKRSRELETELAAAAETITSLRRERAEAIAGDLGLKPEALWATTDLDGLLDEAGAVDREKVAAAVDTAVEKLNVRLTIKNEGLRVPVEGRSPGLPIFDGKATWDNAFRPTYHRQG